MALVITTLHSLAVAVSPSRALVGVDSQRVLSTLRYGVVTTSDPDPEALLSGRAAAELGREEVTVSLAFGQLTRGDAAGTRVLIKEYRADQTPQTPTEIARAKLEGSLGVAPPGGLDQLEALFASDGRSAASIAAAMAENEFAAHLRLQPLQAMLVLLIGCSGGGFGGSMLLLLHVAVKSRRVAVRVQRGHDGVGRYRSTTARQYGRKRGQRCAGIQDAATFALQSPPLGGSRSARASLVPLAARSRYGRRAH